jgi:hypothetical protein
LPTIHRNVQIGRNSARQNSTGLVHQIVPIGASAMLSSKLVKGARLKVYPGAPHGMCSTLEDQINADLFAFFRESRNAAA